MRQSDPRFRPVNPYEKYRYDPDGYARDVLKARWWVKQSAIGRAALTPPYRVLVKASHTVGKSHALGGLVNWWYDTRDPGLCLTTAPTARQVHDVLWKEVRLQRRGRGGFVGPKMPRLESAPDHFAYGFTAAQGVAFQGQHGPAVLIIIDEAVGVDPEIWEACDGMVQGVEYAIIAVCNPTDPTSEFYRREQTGNWNVIHISALEHPNIAAELEEQPPPYPSAVRLAWVMERLAEWCERVDAEDAKPTDIEFPPGSGIWLRPGPLAEGRLLGRWPSQTCGVWSDVLWGICETLPTDTPLTHYPEIGCDVARFGDDSSTFHVRWGNSSRHHESHNGWDGSQIVGRLKQLCNTWAAFVTAARDAAGQGGAALNPKLVPCKVDSDGMGGLGVVDHADGYNFIGVSAASIANRNDDYPNLRSQLWFDLQERAKAGMLSLKLLSRETRARLKTQAMAPMYRLDGAGRRVVEPKDVTKEKLNGQSPDDLDGMNLAYFEGYTNASAAWVEQERSHPHQTMGERIGTFGRGGSNGGRR